MYSERKRGGGAQVQEGTGWHINLQVLKAVWLSLIQFEPHLTGKTLLVRLDNTTTCAYIKRMGEGNKVLIPLQDGDHLLGLMPDQGCYPSRSAGTRCRQCSCRLPLSTPSGSERMEVTRSSGFTLFRICGYPRVDLFTSIHNNQWAQFCSLYPSPVPLAQMPSQYIGDSFPTLRPPSSDRPTED